MVSNVPKTRPAYPPEFRREAVQMLRAGRIPAELAKSLGVSEQTLRNWALSAIPDNGVARASATGVSVTTG
jgi:transposase